MIAAITERGGDRVALLEAPRFAAEQAGENGQGANHGRRRKCRALERSAGLS